MQVLRSIEQVDPGDYVSGSSVAIGKFDGMHLGHRAILESMRESARATGGKTVVFTFTQNPLAYLKPEACPPALMSPAQRLEAFEAAGVDTCVMVDFDEALASTPAEDFVLTVLVGGLNAKSICLGSDFRFGNRRAGSADMLRGIGGELGFEVDEIAWVEVPGFGEASSSRIRSAMLAGDVTAASAMLGHLPQVRGQVVHGDARGRELGFPTANLGGDIEGLVPADGVYAGWVALPGEDGVKWRSAAISIGNNPTFTPDEQSRVESHILDFDGDIYGQTIEVRFVHLLRPTVPFETMEKLVDQIHNDVARTRSLLQLY